MKTLRNWLRKWLAVPDVTDIKPTPLAFAPAVKYSDEQLAAFDAAEIVVIYAERLAETDTIAELCRAYLREQQQQVVRRWGFEALDMSANPKANKAIKQILAELELELAREALGRAEKHASELRGTTEAT